MSNSSIVIRNENELRMVGVLEIGKRILMIRNRRFLGKILQGWGMVVEAHEDWRLGNELK